jgi:hypothetical protein
VVAVRKNIEILTKVTGKLLLFDELVCRYRYNLYVINLDDPFDIVRQKHQRLEFYNAWSGIYVDAMKMRLNLINQRVNI